MKRKREHSGSRVALCTLIAMLFTQRTEGAESGATVAPPAPIFTKMCLPFLPNVRPLPEAQIKLYNLSHCFKLEAYPLGRRNHMHVSFRQWPLVDDPDCENFIATNVSFQAFNKYSWPFGRWLPNSFHQRAGHYCTQEDEEVAAVKGRFQDCDRMMRLPEVIQNPLRSIGQDPTSVRKVNLFRYEIKDEKENKGGICMTWGYSSKNMDYIAASELGGIQNAREYFSGYAVTFRAELFVAPKNPKIPPFLLPLQTRTFRFNGNYSRDHHVSQCHHFSSKNKNFRKELFTTNILLPKPYENFLRQSLAKQGMEKRGQTSLVNTSASQETRIISSQQMILMDVKN